MQESIGCTNSSLDSQPVASEQQSVMSVVVASQPTGSDRAGRFSLDGACAMPLGGYKKFTAECAALFRRFDLHSRRHSHRLQQHGEPAAVGGTNYSTAFGPKADLTNRRSSNSAASRSSSRPRSLSACRSASWLGTKESRQARFACSRSEAKRRLPVACPANSPSRSRYAAGEIFTLSANSGTNCRSIPGVTARKSGPGWTERRPSE